MFSRRNELISGSLIVVVLFIVSVLCLNHCSKKIVKDYHSDASLAPPIHVSKDADGEQHAVQESAKVKDLETQLMQLRAENSRLKSYITKINVGIQTTYVPPKIDSIRYAVHDTFRDSDAIIVPKTLRDSTKNYKIVLTVNKQKWHLDTLQWRDSLSAQIGQPRDSTLVQVIKHVFKQAPVMAEIKTFNPHSTVTGLRSYYYQPDQAWYQKKITWFGVGFGTGVFTYWYFHK